MADREAIFEPARKAASGHTNQHVDEWKADGKPVVGYMCPYTPPEILWAASALPLRLRGVGCDDTSTADALLSGRLCTYVRHVMALVLDGAYGCLDGVVSSNCCDHVRRAADVFAKRSKIGFQGFVSIPRSPRESLFGYYVEELRALYESLTRHLGVEATHDALRKSIAAFNRARRSLARLNELRLLDQPKLTGAEALVLHIASQVMPPPAFCDLMGPVLEKLEDGPGLDCERGRLVLVGAELDEPELVETLESQGALIVADRLCWGARSVLPPIDEEAEDPLEAVARAYFFRPSCARMMGDFPARWAGTVELVEKADAQGVVFQRLMFCDPWGADVHNVLRRAHQKDGLPVLVLEREYGIVPTGQVRTRVQAFVERIEIARARAAVRSRAGQGGE